MPTSIGIWISTYLKDQITYLLTDQHHDDHNMQWMNVFDLFVFHVLAFVLKKTGLRSAPCHSWHQRYTNVLHDVCIANSSLLRRYQVLRGPPGFCRLRWAPYVGPMNLEIMVRLDAIVQSDKDRNIRDWLVPYIDSRNDNRAEMTVAIVECTATSQYIPSKQRIRGYHAFTNAIIKYISYMKTAEIIIFEYKFDNCK